MKKIIYSCMLGLCTLSMTSCSDPMDEITSLIYDRVFSPVDLKARGVSQNSATLQWNGSEGADKYVVEVYADDNLTFEGTPILTYETTNTGLTLTNLVYDTDYSVRVMAVDADDDSRNSKWSEVYFRTSAQQIMNTPKESDIADRSVTFTWPEGEEVTRLVALNAAGEEVVSKELTAEEIAAGKATMGGLQPETTYTVKLYNGNKERGSKIVTTIADLNGAITVSPDDDLQAIIENAEDGQVFALFGGTYTVAGEGVAGSIKVSKNITIKGIYPTNIPTINGRIELNDGASIELNQIRFNGAETSGDQFINIKGTTIGKISISNTEIKNYKKGFIYNNVSANVGDITIENCLIEYITCDGGDYIDFRGGSLNSLTVKNTTFNTGGRTFLRCQAELTKSATFENCTFYNICNVNNSNNSGLFRITNGANATFSVQNCIFYGIGFEGATGNMGVWARTGSNLVVLSESYSRNYWFNSPNLWGGRYDAASSSDVATQADPGFVDAANGNLTPTNEDMIFYRVGDNRWYK